MARNIEENYSLLQEDGLLGSSEKSCHCYGVTAHPSSLSRLNRYFVVGTFVLSIATNALLAAIILRDTDLRKSFLRTQSTDGSRYANLYLDPAVPFPYSTGYGPEEATNHSYADELWESINIDSGVVALPHEWAAQHNLAPSQPFPWDNSKGLYVINGFHTLHCLKNLHRLVYEAHHGWPLSRSVPHTLHCLDHMRKDALCYADDFLMPTPPEHYGAPGPLGQARVCRNWDRLVDWAGSHHACYQHITDAEEKFAQDHNELERYLNCPKNSPYYQQAAEYRQTLQNNGMDRFA